MNASAVTLGNAIPIERERFMAEIGRKGGSARTQRKRQAARRNGGWRWHRKRLLGWRSKREIRWAQLGAYVAGVKQRLKEQQAS